MLAHSFEQFGCLRQAWRIFLYLSFDPLFGTIETFDNAVSLVCQKSVPVFFSLENTSIADNDEPMLGSSDADIDPVLILNEFA